MVRGNSELLARGGRVLVSENSMPGRWTWLIVFGALVGCGGSDAGDADGLVVWDSAGVEIVEHSAAYIAALPVWGVDGDPILELGGGDHPAEQFTSIRGAIRFGDGRVLLAEGGSNELRLFSPDGAYLATWARRGQGPGEFSSISAPRRLGGDSISVYDGNGRRTAVFGPDGGFARQVRDPHSSAAGEHLLPLGLWFDGRVLTTSERMWTPPPSSEGPVTRELFAIGWMASGGSSMDTLVLAPGPELFPGEFSEAGNSYLSYGLVTFGRQPRFGHDGRRLFVGTNEVNDIHQYEGRDLRRIIRNGTPVDPVADADRDREQQRMLAALQQSRMSDAMKTEWQANYARNTRYALTFPYHDRLMLADDGALWVEMWRRYDDQGHRFVIYDTTGRAIARAEFPERVRPLQVGPDFLVGMWRDPDDVPYLRVWKVGGDR